MDMPVKKELSVFFALKSGCGIFLEIQLSLRLPDFSDYKYSTSGFYKFGLFSSSGVSGLGIFEVNCRSSKLD